MVSKHYGISVYWEVQIIHDELVDTEIPVAGVDRDWPFEYFFLDTKLEEARTYSIVTRRTLRLVPRIAEGI